MSSLQIKCGNAFVRDWPHIRLFKGADINDCLLVVFQPDAIVHFRTASYDSTPITADNIYGQIKGTLNRYR